MGIDCIFRDHILYLQGLKESNRANAVPSNARHTFSSNICIYCTRRVHKLLKLGLKEHLPPNIHCSIQSSYIHKERTI